MKFSGLLIAWLWPVPFLLLLIIQAGVDYRAGSNLWPILLIFCVPLAILYYAVLGIGQWIANRPARKEAVALEMATREREEAERRSHVVEEGMHQDRRWRRYDDGRFEGETLAGFRQLASLDEFKRYIA